MLAAACAGDDAVEGVRTSLRAGRGGGELLGLQELRSVSTPVRADRLCLEGPAVAGGALLECDLVPLVDASAASSCDGGGLGEGALDEDACHPPSGPPADAVVGWVVTEPAPGRRRLTVLSGAPAGGSGPEPPLLEQRYVAEDAAGVWSELAVCPLDVDRNGATDLVVLVRSADPGRIDRPELVVVSIATRRGSGRSAPALQQAVAEDDVPRGDGEGCASPVVERLEADGDGLRLRDGRDRPA